MNRERDAAMESRPQGRPPRALPVPDADVLFSGVLTTRGGMSRNC